MSFPTRFARALLPIAIVSVPAAAVAKQSEDLALVRSHLSATHTMTADFAQTDEKGRVMRGTLQLKRPGKIKFQYGRGANMLLVADGKKLTFVDYQVGQKNSWDLNKTPLGVLLSPNPNLERVAKVLPNDDPRLLILRARDPSHNEFGTLILAFIREKSAPGGLRLYGWTAVDAQGKRTTVTLSNQHYNVGVPDSAFTYAEPKKRARS